MLELRTVKIKTLMLIWQKKKFELQLLDGRDGYQHFGTAKELLVISAIACFPSSELQLLWDYKVQMTH